MNHEPEHEARAQFAQALGDAESRAEFFVIMEALRREAAEWLRREPAELLPQFKAEAKERQGHRPKIGEKLDGSAGLAATAVGVSRSYVEQAEP